MAYNKYNSYKKSGYGSGSGYGQNNQNGYSGNRPVTKKSGAEYTRIKKGKNEGQMAVNAWRKTRFGIQTASAMPVGGGQVHESQKGNEFIRYAVEVANKTLGTSQTYWCLMNTKTQMIVIKELGLVISPNGRGVTGSGKRVTGYFGKFK